MSATEQLVAALCDDMMERLTPYLERQRATVVSEEDVMRMLGVSRKDTMAALRSKGLRGHRIDYRRWVYMMDDVEAFVEGCPDY